METAIALVSLGIIGGCLLAGDVSEAVAPILWALPGLVGLLMFFVVSWVFS